MLLSLASTALALLGMSPPRTGSAVRSIADGVDRKWPASLTSHVVRGIRGAVAESADVGGVKGKRIAVGRIASLVAQDLLFFPVKMIPFAVRTTYYRNVTSGVQTFEAGRNLLEVYSRGGNPDGPLVVYVHGGSWGQGEPWQYALLARRLLEDGQASRVAVVKYRLFPDGDVDSMLGDIGSALEWCQAEQQAAAKAGRPPLRVVLAAQSAGAHLCALYLSRQAWHGIGGWVATTTSGDSAAAPPELWKPDKFVALSGVFDIASHFAHERSRLVHWLSPMWLAMIGRARAEKGDGAAGATPGSADRGSYVAEVVEAMGLSTHGAGSLLAAAAAAKLDAAALEAAEIDARALARKSQLPAQARDARWSDRELAAWAAASPTQVLRLLSLALGSVMPAGDGMRHEALRTAWPPTVVLHAADDKTVPVQSARDLVSALAHGGLATPSSEAVEAEGKGADGQEKALVQYIERERGGHGEAMVALMSRMPCEELPPLARDFVSHVCE
jgi:acetyl esterase/lipase